MKNLDLDEVVSILDLHRNYQREEDTPSIAGYHLVLFEGKQYYSSTDANRLVLIPKQEYDLNYNAHEKAVKIERVLPSIDMYNCSKTINVNKIYYLCDQIPFIDGMTECEACDGEGEFDHYGESYDCKSCDGTGEVKSGIKVKDPNHLIKIENTTISNSIAYDLFKVGSVVEDFSFTVLLSNEYQIFLSVGDIFILIMAKVPNDQSTIIKPYTL